MLLSVSVEHIEDRPSQGSPSQKSTSFLDFQEVP
jgi:hypothetical protein